MGNLTQKLDVISKYIVTFTDIAGLRNFEVLFAEFNIYEILQQLSGLVCMGLIPTKGSDFCFVTVSRVWSAVISILVDYCQLAI